MSQAALEHECEYEIGGRVGADLLLHAFERSSVIVTEGTGFVVSLI